MLSDGLKLITAILATYRLAVLVNSDDGPFDIIDNMRNAIKKNAPGSAMWSTLASLVDCQYCLGVWIALAICIIISHDKKLTNALVFALGVAGGQHIIASALEVTDDNSFISDNANS